MFFRLLVGCAVALIVIEMVADKRGAHTATIPTAYSCDTFDKLVADSQHLVFNVCIRPHPKRMAVSWDEALGAQTYRVSGSVNYWPEPCAAEQATSTKFDLTNIVPADRTYYEFPQPSNPDDYWIKDFDVQVQAVNAGGAVIKGNGMGMTAEPPTLAMSQAHPELTRC